LWHIKTILWLKKARLGRTTLLLSDFVTPLLQAPQGIGLKLKHQAPKREVAMRTGYLALAIATLMTTTTLPAVADDSGHWHGLAVLVNTDQKVVTPMAKEVCGFRTGLLLAPTKSPELVVLLRAGSLEALM
jgi:hypothetical protein